jgi:hypothetical protein
MVTGGPLFSATLPPLALGLLTAVTFSPLPVARRNSFSAAMTIVRLVLLPAPLLGAVGGALTVPTTGLAELTQPALVSVT